MKHSLPILVFTDLDGTLMDHETYRWDSAIPALDALKHVGAGVVLASSKTSAELCAIRDEMGLSQWPAIVENGAGLLPANSLTEEDNEQYKLIRAALDQLPTNLRQHFRGFGDMALSELVELTGLSSKYAHLAIQRNYSEPGLWDGTDEKLQLFISALSEKKISARAGGRFLTLSFGQTKADQMAVLIEQYQPDHTIALGDAPNDVEMLESADYGVIVNNPHSKPLHSLKNEQYGQIIRTTLTGPHGWNVAILEIIAKLEP